MATQCLGRVMTRALILDNLSARASQESLHPLPVCGQQIELVVVHSVGELAAFINRCRLLL